MSFHVWQKYICDENNEENQKKVEKQLQPLSAI